MGIRTACDYNQCDQFFHIRFLLSVICFRSFLFSAASGHLSPLLLTRQQRFDKRALFIQHTASRMVIRQNVTIPQGGK